MDASPPPEPEPAVEPAASASPRVRARWPLVTIALVGAGLLALALFGLGRVSVAGTVPGETSADVGFLRDMQVHHAQAVEMALLVRDRTDDPEIRMIAYDIATAQSQQAGVMYGWLEQWGVSQLASDPMAWMTAGGHEHGGGASAAPGDAPDALMPGMATPAQFAALRDAEGIDAVRLFLELMIAHHQGGVEMARAAQDLATEPLVRSMAERTVESQGAEISAMTQMLAARAG